MIRAFVLLTALFALSAAPTSVGEPVPNNSVAPASTAAFEDSGRVTAIDTWVEVDRGRLAAWASGGKVRDQWRPEDFRVLLEGEERQVIGVGQPGSEEPGERWRIVLYFDVELSSQRTVRWAAEELGKQAAALTALGDVEVVVADPLPRRLLLPGGDGQELAAVLADLALHPPGRDALVTLRGDVLEELEAGSFETGMAPGELARWAATEEGQLVRRQQDRLLGWLVDAGALGKKALFWVGDGYDLRPSTFYEPQIDRERAEGEPLAASLEAASRDQARTVAAYGWVAFPFKAAAPEPPPPGVRIGKWRVQGKVFGPFVVGGAVREAERDPEMADAYLELGKALHVQGKLEQAEDAYRKAVHHYYRDPRTADRQALAWAGLGRVLKDLGETQKGRSAFRQALDLDPELALEDGVPAGILIAPTVPLEELATASGGVVARSSRDLSEALSSLGRRLRVTYQLEGMPDGRLWPLEVTSKKGKALRSAAWARWSTPTTVTEARLRLAPSEVDSRGELDLRVTLEPASADGSYQLALALLPETLEEIGVGGALPRVSWASGTGERLLAVEHGLPEAVLTDNSSTEGSAVWSWRHELVPVEGAEWIAVVVEDLLTSGWRVELLPLDDARAVDP